MLIRINPSLQGTVMDGFSKKGKNVDEFKTQISFIFTNPILTI
jgi:hypothetical protein